MLLAAGFPLTVPSGIQGAKDSIRSLMPTFEQAATFTEAFFAHAMWLGTPISREYFFENILAPLYRSKSWEEEDPGRMALLCTLLAVGCILDLTRAPYDSMAFKLHQLGSACLALAKPLEAPTMISLEAMVRIGVALAVNI